MYVPYAFQSGVYVKVYKCIYTLNKYAQYEHIGSKHVKTLWLHRLWLPSSCGASTSKPHTATSKPRPGLKSKTLGAPPELQKTWQTWPQHEVEPSWRMSWRMCIILQNCIVTSSIWIFFDKDQNALCEARSHPILKNGASNHSSLYHQLTTFFSSLAKRHAFAVVLTWRYQGSRTSEQKSQNPSGFSWHILQLAKLWEAAKTHQLQNGGSATITGLLLITAQNRILNSPTTSS